MTKTPDFGLRRRKAAEFATLGLRRAESGLQPRFLAPGNVFEHVTMSDIGPSALQDWRRYWRFNPSERIHGSGGWDWPGIYDRARRADRDYFAVCGLLDGNLLFMLSLGRLTKSALVIRFLERIPSYPPTFVDRFGSMKGLAATCAFAAAEYYARLCDRRDLVLDQPLPGVIPYYTNEHGFTWAPSSSGEDVLSRRVGG